MSNIFAFSIYNFFVDIKEENLLFIVIIGVLFDLFIYSLFPFHLILFLVLYYFNSRLRVSTSIFKFALRGIINMTIALLTYAVYTEHISYLSSILPYYMVNIILSIILYFLKERRIIFSHS